ncbi:MAG: DUF433 domain-containing protein [bacterium]
MLKLKHTAINPEVMGGKPCIRGLRVTIGTIAGLVASRYSVGDILHLFPLSKV